MYGGHLRAPKVDLHNFAMIPRADIPRSSFRMQQTHKTTFTASQLIPIYLQETLPGDHYAVKATIFARLATPLYPIMDNLDIETFFFFVPNRLVWVNWTKFMGQQDNPGDSISYTIPQVVSPVGGFTQLSIYDYFGVPVSGQIAAGNTISISALPFRAYNLIFDEWFRDQNLNTGALFGSTSTTGQAGTAVMDNGPDPQTNYGLKAAAKRADYFTKCLPWTQKATNPISIPLNGNAIVKTSASNGFTGAQQAMTMLNVTGAGITNLAMATGGTGQVGGIAGGPGTTFLYPANLYADLSTATSTTINALRLAFQTQKLLERDARGGTRYTEIIRSHFGISNAGGDARLQRPEYLGGGKTPINIAPVPQTTATGLTGGTSPLGTLSAAGTAVASHGFTQQFTEHGHIIGLALVRANMTYQQGIRKLWKRLTRYDFFFPVFSMIGEQAVYNYELYADGSANDNLVFGYQEAWANYRYHPSYTSGFFRSTNATPLDAWHLAEKFTSLPTLGAAFINDSTQVTMERVIAAGAQGLNQEILADIFFDQKVARPMPMYSVPGMIDHF